MGGWQGGRDGGTEGGREKERGVSITTHHLHWGHLTAPSCRLIHSLRQSRQAKCLHGSLRGDERVVTYCRQKEHTSSLDILVDVQPMINTSTIDAL